MSDEEEERVGEGEKEGDKSVLLPFPNVMPGNRGCECASLPTSESIDCVRRGSRKRPVAPGFMVPHFPNNVNSRVAAVPGHPLPIFLQPPPPLLWVLVP